jgi:hypothetical protein
MRSAVGSILLAVVACKSSDSARPSIPAPEIQSPLLPPPRADARPRAPADLPRLEFNRWAVRANQPVYWIADRDGDGAIDPDEVAGLLFYPTSGTRLVTGGGFTHEFWSAYDAIVAASRAPAPDPSTEEGKRRQLVGLDLDQGRASLVFTDFTRLSASDKAFVGHMMRVAELIDRLYEELNGAAALAPKLPADFESRSLFRRNRGPTCVAPATENEPLCSAIPGSPRPIFGLYPAELQAKDKFCGVIEKHRDAKALLAPFVVVRGTPPQLTAVPYTEAYRDHVQAIAKELGAAADAVTDPSEAALVTYLRAAATSFETNNWVPADEAWSKMTVDNSKWYVRVAPDEVYWEPCSSKAGPHLTFARIDQGSRAWQQKLAAVQQEMEAQIAQRAGRPYVARKVTFHLPDFIAIVINAGDDRDALGATIGQSLPNWGPVANEGRGRTVAMVNLYTDPDSRDARRAQAESLLDAASMQHYADDHEPGLLNTILHEATHNLGPAHEYKVGGRTASQIFTGPIASMLEELKAQTGALFLIEFLRSRQLISDELARRTYADAIVWALGHISQGMYDADGKPKAYSQLAAIHIGFLLDKGVLVWDGSATAANGKDSGAFAIQLDKVVPVVDEMMKLTAGIKARGDREAARKLIARYVDGTVVPHATIRERFLRFPKASFVYAVAM